MSTLDQPILIANSNYHVGHQVAIFVAEEQGFFREEGINNYEYDARGLIPGPLERDGLAMAITNHGGDVATAVDVEAAGVDPEKEVEWVYDPVFGYRNSPAHMEMLRSGKIDAITSQPPFSDQLEKEGYPMILDPSTVFPRRPGKLTVATGQTIEKRADELRAYFRAIIRAFWFMRDVKNFEYLRDLEKRLRKTNTHNEDERGV